ncbi:MAG: M48 family metallopeptidase [Deltaproteobacteria bacterium]|nr:M48 family metallopeptidase [Deltaproteobacteria bacterium]
MTDSDGPNIPIWVPPGQHDRPKPGSPEWQEEMERAATEGREPWSRPIGGVGGAATRGGLGADDSAAQGGQKPSGQAPSGQAPSGQASSGHGPSGQDAAVGSRGPVVSVAPVAVHFGAQVQPNAPRSGSFGGSAGGFGAAQQQAPSPASSVPQSTGGAMPPAPVAPAKKSGSKLAMWIVVAVVGTVGGIYGSYRLFLVFLDWSATKVPVSWEISLGRSAAKDVLSKSMVCSDPRLNAFVDRLGRRLQSGMRNPRYRFRFKVIQVKAINAFALPGGYVFIHSGLLRKADSAEEVAGVLAHEVQHVILRHGIRRIVRKAGLAVAVRIIFGTGVTNVLASSALSLVSLKYDRGEERQADMEGVKLMYRAGIDPNALPKFFEKLVEKEKEMGSTGRALLPYVSDHPLSSERIRVLRAYIRKHGVPKNLRPIGGDFDAVKNLCSPGKVLDPDKVFAPAGGTQDRRNGQGDEQEQGAPSGGSS